MNHSTSSSSTRESLEFKTPEINDEKVNMHNRHNSEQQIMFPTPPSDVRNDDEGSSKYSFGMNFLYFYNFNQNPFI